MNNNFDTRQYQPVNECIYCGVHGDDVQLSKEHIIPYAFGGKTVLPKASCSGCAKITSEFERICAKDFLGDFRAQQAYPTRNRKNRATELSLSIQNDCATKVIQVPLLSHPGSPLIAMEVGAPGIVLGQSPSEIFNEIEPVFLVASSQQTQTALGQIQQRFGSPTSVNVTALFSMPPFARMLAKIAHAYTVAQYGLKSFKPLLLDVILGKDKNIAYLIGGTKDPLPDIPQPEGGQYKHRQAIGILRLGEQNYLEMRIQLFSYIGFPVYRIIVGIPTDELLNRLNNKLMTI